MANSLLIFQGWCSGYNQGNISRLTAENTQAKEYPLTGFLNSIHFLYLRSGASSSYIDTLPEGMTKTAIRIGSLIASPIFYVFGAIKAEEDLNLGFTILKTSELGLRPKQIGNFMAKHSGSLLTVAGIASSIAMIILIGPYYGGGMLAGQLYGLADSAEFIPEKISLFMRTYMKDLSTFGLIIYGGTFQRFISIINLSSSLSPSFKRFLLYKIDDIALNIFGGKGIKLEDFEAPMKNNKQMNYEQIKKILNDTTPYKIDPAHCSKSIIAPLALPKSLEFKNLLTEFDNIGWESKYNVLKIKLATDPRFIDFIQDAFPKISKAELKDSNSDNINDMYPVLDKCITELAAKESLTKEKFTEIWMRQQMSSFVETMEGKIPVKNSRHLLKAAINNTAKIIPCLENIKQKNPLLLETLLISLAIDGGGYPSPNLQKATSKALMTALKEGNTCDDLMLKEEIKMTIAFQDLRSELFTKAFNIFFDSMLQEFSDPKTPSEKIQKSLSQISPLLKEWCSIGFLPNEINFSSMIVWELSRSFFSKLVPEYELNIASHMETVMTGKNLASYSQQLIKENNSLTEEQKTEFINQINPQNLESMKSFQRLTLVSLGFLHKS